MTKKNDEQGNVSAYGVEYAAMEWGVKNNLRPFGIMIATMDFHGCGGPAEKVALRAKVFFTDPLFKSMELHVFDIKEKSGVVTVTKTKGLKGFKYPIKFTRTRNFANNLLAPVFPLYAVLVVRRIILPFQSTLKNEEWTVLPFEDGTNIEPTKI